MSEDVVGRGENVFGQGECALVAGKILIFLMCYCYKLTLLILCLGCVLLLKSLGYIVQVVCLLGSDHSSDRSSVSK